MTPDTYTNQELMLDVGDGHSLYVHDWGNPKAKQPILMLHGGPGDGSSDSYKQLFDPRIHRVIFHDQRGSGRSLPYGELAHNTTDELVEDIETIARKLHLSAFTLTGSSWGSCLALLYALKYPKRVSQLIVSGIFDGSQSEMDWIDQGYFKLFFPEIWERYVQATPKSYANDPTAYHRNRILGANDEKAAESAQAYDTMVGSLMRLDHRPAAGDLREVDLAAARLTHHYFANDCFLKPNYIMRSVSRLNMPVWIVQGRHDMACPPATAYELHQRIKGSTLLWAMSGHARDRSTYDILRTLFVSPREG